MVVFHAIVVLIPSFWMGTFPQTPLMVCLQYRLTVPFLLTFKAWIHFVGL